MAQMKTVSAPAAKRPPRVLAGNVSPHGDESRTQALKHYEAALKLMQEHRYDQAHVAFEKMLATSPADLAHSIRMYLNACMQQRTKRKAEFLSQEEHFDYAVSLLND